MVLRSASRIKKHRSHRRATCYANKTTRYASLPNWRIKIEDVNFEQKVGQGGEGGVFRGTLQVHLGLVALKKLNGLASMQ